MTLEKRLNTINTPQINNMPNVGLLPDGKAATIKEFFDTFVEPRLPDEDIIRGWHKLLMDYTADLTSISCCIRFGNHKAPATGTKWNQYGYDALRRGWVTQNTADSFEYFFADNHFCTYICKLALSGFVPSLVEFSDAFHNHKFPYGFMFYLKNHPEVDGAVAALGKNPGFSGNYKISHVFDAGAYFLVNGKIRNDAELSDLYYPIGHSNDFLKNSDHIRRMDISDEAKRVIIAKFLRFAHPFNYFLTPTTRPKLHTYDSSVSIKKNDIGEDDQLLYYIRNYLKNKYPDVYKEFLERTLWPYDPNITYPDTGSNYIGMDYGPYLKGNTSVSAADKPATRTKNDIDLRRINNYAYLNSFKIGEIAKQVLSAIFKSGKISKAEVNKWKTDTATKAAFGFGRPLLSPDKKDAKGYNRYYDEPLDLYGETLYLYSQWLVGYKKRLINWIVNWADINGSII